MWRKVTEQQPRFKAYLQATMPEHLGYMIAYYHVDFNHALKAALVEPDFREVPAQLDPKELVDVLNPAGPQLLTMLLGDYLHPTPIIGVSRWRQPDREVGPFTDPPLSIDTCALFMSCYLEAATHLVGGGNFARKVMVRRRITNPPTFREFACRATRPLRCHPP
jgi:hypothetical protein